MAPVEQLIPTATLLREISSGQGGSSEKLILHEFFTNPLLTLGRRGIILYIVVSTQTVGVLTEPEGQPKKADAKGPKQGHIRKEQGYGS